MKAFITIIALGVSVATLAADVTQKLPSRDPATVIPLLKRLEGRPEVRQVEEILGRHDREAGSGRCMFVYVLQDRSEIWVDTGDCEHLGWIMRLRQGQQREVIFEVKDKSVPPPAHRGSDHP